ncbi:hypothetical protein DL95DRAFT_459546 [Leptodontidium sp. 2 PMI_412]|nr:hypothetical protein DL95DRAFT_459546 [Leptodontidium sp. 2 PMI_412]
MGLQVAARSRTRARELVTPPIIQPIYRLGVHRCGLNVANLTGVIFSAQDLFKGDILACASFSILQQGIPNFLSTIVNDLALVTSFVNKYVGPLVGGLNCPEIKGQSTGLLIDFPGYKYSPTGPGTNY